MQRARRRIACIQDVHKAEANGSLHPQPCRDPCNQEKYEITSSIDYLFLRNWFSHLRSIAWRLTAANSDLEGLRKWLFPAAVCCFSQIHVMTESERSDRIEEKESYPLANLLSDVGGTLGLWVGFSVITIFEFIELPLRLVANKISE